MQASYIGAYWGDRRETAFECGERLSRCLLGLGAVDPLLAAWFLKGSRRSTATVPIALGADDLARLFDRGRNRRDSDGEVIEELGFRVGLWNNRRPALGLSAHCGSYANQSGLLNSFVLSVPAPDSGAEVLYQVDPASAIFEIIVESWEPHWATWSTHEWREAQSPARREPVIGWKTYLANWGIESLSFGVGKPLADGVLIESASQFSEVDGSFVVSARRKLNHMSLLHPIP